MTKDNLHRFVKSAAKASKDQPIQVNQTIVNKVPNFENINSASRFAAVGIIDNFNTSQSSNLIDSSKNYSSDASPAKAPS